MANVRTSAKRAKQEIKRNTRNQIVKATTRSALKGAIDALKSQNLDKAKAAYTTALKVVSKAASKGSIPKNRAARKISRLTRLIKKSLPKVLSAK